jgi:hypothetical protein
LIFGIGFGVSYLTLGVFDAEIFRRFSVRGRNILFFSVQTVLVFSIGWTRGVAVGLVVANLTLPPENLILQIGNQNMPWVPPIVLGTLGLLLIATSNQGEENKEKKK